jgi:TRAP-type C4-dicarboxylate transport system substrate-binding protein
MHLFFCIATIALALTGLTARSAAEPQELVFIHAGSPGSIFDLSASEFKRRLDQKLPENLSVSIVANPALGDGLSLLDSIKNGRATFALTSSAMIALSNRFAIFELPFLITSRRQIRAIRAALLDRFLQPEASQNGLHILGVWENGFRQFTNDLRPIHLPGDLKQLKIAVPPANPWRERLIFAFGGEPLAMAGRALHEALRNEIADGQESPLAEIAALELMKTQRHLTLSDHLYSPAFLLTSSAHLKAMPDAVRTLVISEAVAMEDWIQKTAIGLESELIDRLDQTMEVSQIDKQAFKLTSRSLYGDFVRRVPDGAKMIQLLQAAAIEPASKPD